MTVRVFHVIRATRSDVGRNSESVLRQTEQTLSVCQNRQRTWRNVPFA
jgi:hypothetical protein